MPETDEKKTQHFFEPIMEQVLVGQKAKINSKTKRSLTLIVYFLVFQSYFPPSLKLIWTFKRKTRERLMNQEVSSHVHI